MSIIELVVKYLIGLSIFYWGYLIGTLKSDLVIKRYEIKKHLEELERRSKKDESD